jgi:hypothetical protein
MQALKSTDNPSSITCIVQQEKDVPVHIGNLPFGLSCGVSDEAVYGTHEDTDVSKFNMCDDYCSLY